jgi:hypothetical protein
MEKDFTTWFFEPKVIKPLKLKESNSEKIVTAIATVIFMGILVWAFCHAAQVDKMIFSGQL